MAAPYYYSTWSEQDLLAELQMVEKQLSAGRITEIRLAGELTRTDHASDYTPLERTWLRLNIALWKGSPWKSGNSYDDPTTPVITQQSHY